MDIAELLLKARDCHTLVFSGHAVQRMFERGVTETEVRGVIEAGEVIASYPDDRPYPTCLMLGFRAALPLHVVIAWDRGAATCHVVTVYVPDPKMWHPDYRTRRSS